MLTDKNRELVLVLQKNPLANYNQLADLLGSTPPTIKRRMDSLQMGTNPVIISVLGSIDHLRIGLELDSFLIDLKPGIEPRKFQQLFDLFDYHPYTSFQNRCFGAINGSLVQIYRPSNSKIEYTDLFDRISDEFHIQRLIHLPQMDYGVDSYPELHYWKGGKWDFDFYKWFEHGTDEKVNLVHRKDVPNFQRELELPHVIMLRELSSDSRRKQVEFMDQIQHSDQYSDEEKALFAREKQREVSRYQDFIAQKELIRDYYLLYNRQTFGIFNQVALIGRMNHNDLNRLLAMVHSSDNPLPFRSKLGVKDDQFFWWINLPPHHSMEVMNFAFELADTLDTMMLDTSINYSRTYPLWHRNFKDTEKTWIKDEDWIIKRPLDNIGI